MYSRYYQKLHLDSSKLQMFCFLRVLIKTCYKLLFLLGFLTGAAVFPLLPSPCKISYLKALGSVKFTLCGKSASAHRVGLGTLTWRCSWVLWGDQMWSPVSRDKGRGIGLHAEERPHSIRGSLHRQEAGFLWESLEKSSLPSHPSPCPSGTNCRISELCGK